MKKIPAFRAAAVMALFSGTLAVSPPAGAAASAPGAATAAAVAPTVPAPVIPAKTFRVAAFGAVGDGKTKNTAALQKAIDACAKAGGGTVVVPAGRYLTGPLVLASSLELRLEKGATLLLSDEPRDFKLENNRYEDCISARDCHDVAITGAGVIDGQGTRWWRDFMASRTAPSGTPPAPHRPFLVVLSGCTRVLVEGVTLQNSPMFHLVPQKCRDVRIDGIRIQAPEEAKNTDGLDPSGWNFLITNCVFNVGDDCIALKPSGRIDPGQPACRDFVITNCDFQHGHGMSVGGQTPGGLKNLTVRDCTFEGTDAGIRLKASRGAGGLVEDLTYENLTMKDVKVPVEITSYYSGNSPGQGRVEPAQDPAQPVTATTPIWRNVRIRNVTATGATTAGIMYGLAEMPISGVTFTDVKLTARKGMRIVHAKGVRFVNSRVVAAVGAPVVLEDAEVAGIDRSGAPTAASAAAGKPARVFDVRRYGAAGDGKAKDTAAIARAVTACAAAGGGRVLLPAGTYLTGPVELKSGVDLHLDPGATVLFSRDHDDYPLAVTRYEGLEAVRCRSPLWGENLHDVAITGPGVFDGQGETWRPARKAKLPPAQWDALVASGGYVDDAGGTWWPSRGAAEGDAAVKRLRAAGGAAPAVGAYRPYRDFLRPTLVELAGCRGVVLDGPTFRNSPAWNIHVLLCDDVTVRNVTSFNPWWAQNGDGIDIDSCRRVLVADSVFDAGDDGICLKSGKDEEGRRLGRPTEDVTVRNCTVLRGHGGVTIGSEMSGGVRRVAVSDCVFDGTDIGLRFKSTRGRGGVVEEVRVADVEMSGIRGAAISFDMYYQVTDPKPEPVSERTPRFRRFQIRDVTCQGAQSALLIRGLPEMPIEGVTLENVRIAADAGGTLTDARDITLRDVRVQAGGRPSLQCQHVENLKMERVEGLKATDA